jgi:stearoyl-CoA desaturase (delta-9 desaturase)
MFSPEITNSMVFARDLLRDPLMVRINRLYPLWVGLGLLLPTLVGGLVRQSWLGALEGFLWGGMVRLFLVHHAFWSIGGIAHTIGSRPYHTHESSTNNFWLAIPNYGEGWHNNHHAFPNSALFGLEWWQVDFGAWTIRTLEFLRLIWDVQVPSQAARAARRIAPEQAVGDLPE